MFATKGKRQIFRIHGVNAGERTREFELATPEITDTGRTGVRCVISETEEGISVP